ncbi:hypothetical protein GF352_00995 [archaeon]|nr:hypothetical protein [archaeon]
MIKDKRLLAQLVVVVGIVVLLSLAAFVISADDVVFFLIPLIIANLVLVFLNKTKGLAVNIALLALTPLMFMFLLEYLASLIGFVLGIIHLVRFSLGLRKKK